MQAELAAHSIFRPDIGARSRIIPNENDGEPGRNALCFQFCYLPAKIYVHLIRNRAAIDKLCHTSVFVIPSEVEPQRSPECFRGEARLSNPVALPLDISAGSFDSASLRSG